MLKAALRKRVQADATVGVDRDLIWEARNIPLSACELSEWVIKFITRVLEEQAAFLQAPHLFCPVKLPLYYIFRILF